MLSTRHARVHLRVSTRIYVYLGVCTFIYVYLRLSTFIYVYLRVRKKKHESVDTLR